MYSDLENKGEKNIVPASSSIPAFALKDWREKWESSGDPAEVVTRIIHKERLIQSLI